MFDQSPKDAKQDNEQTFFDMVNVDVFDIGSIFFSWGKNYLENLRSIKNTGEKSHFKADV